MPAALPVPGTAVLECLAHVLDGLTEEQARRSLVPSRTTLLGLVKHATFVEKVWFDEAIACRSRAEIGIPATPAGMPGALQMELTSPP